MYIYYVIYREWLGREAMRGIGCNSCLPYHTVRPMRPELVYQVFDFLVRTPLFELPKHFLAPLHN